MKKNIKMSMKWHNFLVNCGLWISGIANIFAGVLLFMMLLFNKVGNLPPIVLLLLSVVSVMSVGIGVLSIGIRYQLADKRCEAPRNLFLMQLFSGNIFMALLNHLYYEKRSQLFVH